MLGRQARAIALDLRATAIGRQHDVAFVDLGTGNPGVVVEDFPGRRDAARQVELHPGGVALARQQLLLGRGVGVGVALVVFFAVERGHAQAGAFFKQLEFAADFKVAAFFRIGIGGFFGACVRVGELVGIARGVVRGAVRDVVRGAVIGLVKRTDARAPQAI